MILVGAVGNSRTRWALAQQDASGWTLAPVRIEATIVEGEIALAHFLDSVGRPALTGAAICGAGHLLDNERLQLSDDDDIEVDARRLAEVANCPVHLLSLADAVAHALPALPASELHTLRAGTAKATAAKLVIGIGAELDVSIVAPDGAGARVLSGEAGHFDLVPVDDDELPVWLALREALGRVSAENIFTPAGLLALHRARSCAARSTEILIRDALAGEEQPQQTLQLYSRWFGRMLGSLALLSGTRGGVYLSGSIVASGLEWFDVEAFSQGFDDHAPAHAWLSRTPLYAITHPQPALLGCAVVAAAHVAPLDVVETPASREPAGFVA